MSSRSMAIWSRVLFLSVLMEPRNCKVPSGVYSPVVMVVLPMSTVKIMVVPSPLFGVARGPFLFIIVARPRKSQWGNGLCLRRDQKAKRIWYHTAPPWAEEDTPSLTKPNLA